jgi:hypothetical protein
MAKPELMLPKRTRTSVKPSATSTSHEFNSLDRLPNSDGEEVTRDQSDTLKSTLALHAHALTWTKDQRVVEAADGINSSAYPSAQDWIKLSARLHRGRMPP